MRPQKQWTQHLYICYRAHLMGSGNSSHHYDFVAGFKYMTSGDATNGSAPAKPPFICVLIGLLAA